MGNYFCKNKSDKEFFIKDDDYNDNNRYDKFNIRYNKILKNQINSKYKIINNK